MEREYKTIITPYGKQKVVLKTWITGSEKRNISTSLLIGMSVSNLDVESVKLTPELINKAQDVAFEQIIVSIDGSEEEVLESILNMRGEDYDLIVSEVNKITNPSDELKKE